MNPSGTRETWKRDKQIPSHKATSPREMAMEVLLRCEKSGQYSNLALDQVLRNSSAGAADRALATRLCYGVTEKQILLDAVLSSLSNRPIDRLDPRVRAALRMGVYQILYLDRVPDHAAVDESVRLVPPRAAGFVNALLRGFLRSGKRIPLPDRTKDPLRYLSVAYSVPEPLVRVLARDRSVAQLESLLAAFDRRPPLTLRVNTLRTTREMLLERFSEAGISAAPCRYSPVGITLPGTGDDGGVGSPIGLPGFAEGHFFVQDEASQICTAALDAHAGQVVVDTCACPGSKSFGIAADMNNEGRLHSFDLHENKLSLVRSGAGRLGIGILTAAKRDGRQPDPALVGQADRVLCDVPCSGYGVIAKKPEIRFKSPAMAAGLPEIQLAIARASVSYLRAGGVMVYSTCTILREENEDNLHRLLQACPGLKPEPFSVGDLQAPDGYLTLYPDAHGTDGFFVAKLRYQPEEA